MEIKQSKLLFSDYAKIAFGLSAPVLWGLLTFWGPPMPFTYHPLLYQVKMLIRLLIAYGVVWLLWGKQLDYAAQNFRVYLFGYRLPLPSWHYLVWAVASAIVLSFPFLPLWEYPIIMSFVQATLLSSCIEELATHAMFAVYPFTPLLFFMLNIIASSTFGLMHAWYCVDPIASWCDLAFGSHFVFAFLLGIIAYQTRRIEIPIILHTLSNFGYLIFTIMLKQPESSLGWLTTLKFVVAMMFVVGACKRDINE